MVEQKQIQKKILSALSSGTKQPQAKYVVFSGIINIQINTIYVIINIFKNIILQQTFIILESKI